MVRRNQTANKQTRNDRRAGRRLHSWYQKKQKNKRKQNKKITFYFVCKSLLHCFRKDTSKTSSPPKPDFDVETVPRPQTSQPSLVVPSPSTLQVPSARSKATPVASQAPVFVAPTATPTPVETKSFGCQAFAMPSRGAATQVGGFAFVRLCLCLYFILLFFLSSKRNMRRIKSLYIFVRN